jgi:hypothetical protein
MHLVLLHAMNTSGRIDTQSLSLVLDGVVWLASRSGLSSITEEGTVYVLRLVVLTF